MCYSDRRGFNLYRPKTASYFGAIVYRSYKAKTVKYIQPNWPARLGHWLLYRYPVDMMSLTHQCRIDDIRTVFVKQR